MALVSKDRRSRKFIRIEGYCERPNGNVMNTCTLMTRFSYQFLLATILLPTSIVLAGADSYDVKSAPPAPEAPWCEPPAPLEIRIGIPGWISGMSGDFGVRGIVSPLDVRFTDILDRLDQIPIVLSAYVRYHRWEFFGDGQYLKLSDSVTLPGILFDRADIEAKSVFVEAFVGYQLINCERPSYLCTPAPATTI